MQQMSLQKYIFLTLLLLFCNISPHVQAQNFGAQSDSLLQLLPQTQDVEKRIDLFNEIAYSFRRHRPDSLFHYANLALELAQKEQYERGLMVAYKNIGIYRFKREFPADSILHAYEAAASYADKIKDSYQQAAITNNIGLVINTQNKLNEAIRYFLEALAILRENNEPPSRLEGLINGNISKCYRDKNELAKAKSYLDDAFAVAEVIGDRTLFSIYGDDYGGILLDLGRIEEGMAYLKRAIPLQESLSDYQSLTQTYMELANQYLKLKELDLAESYIILAQQQEKIHGFDTFDSGILLTLSQIKLQQGKLDEAIKFGQQCVESSNYTDRSYYASTAYQVLGDAYSTKGDFERAYLTQLKHKELQERINATEKAILAEELEAQFQIEEQQRTINALNELHETRDRQLIFLIIIAALLLLLLIGGVVALLENRKKQQIISQKNEELESYIDQNLQLENFVHIASHDLKSPLRNITSFAQLMKRRLAKEEYDNLEEYLQFIIRAGDGLSNLVEDLLQYSIVSKEPNEVSEIDLPQLISQVLEGIQSSIKKTRAEVSVDLATETILGDATKLKQLFQNLILNGLKFQASGNKPVIRIVCKDQSNQWLFTVEDNGIGIEKEYQNQIFVMLKRLHSHDQYEGTGVGLAICKSIVEQHNGRIWVSSSPGVGSIFHFLIDKTLTTTSKAITPIAPPQVEEVNAI